MSEYLPIISFVVGYVLSQLWIEFRDSRRTFELDTAKMDRQFHATREFIEATLKNRV